MTVVDDLQVEGFKTKRIVEILDALGLSGSSVLIVIDDANPTVEASARNIPGVGVIRSDGLNVHDLLRHKHMVITKAAVEKLEARLTGAASEGDAQ